MLDECALRRRLLDMGFSCDEESCALWAQLGIDGKPQCAVQYFKLLEAPGDELAEWLMSLKGEQIAEALGLRNIPSHMRRPADA